jgi:chromosome partitioning protein
MQAVTTGTIAGAGSFRCEDCGYVLTLPEGGPLPACASCGSERFLATSTFTGRTVAVSGPSPVADPGLLDFARERATPPGQYLAYEDAGDLRLVPLAREWTRIGRSLAADVRFDDATVSRRHALVVRSPDGVRVLDDRSLNGVFVNGERVEWRVLADGDEVVVGRHRLRFLDTEAVPRPPGPPWSRRPRPSRARRAGRPHAILPPVATKIAVLSQKGGTGKTTAVRTLTDVFRLAGLRVLAVDLDPQGNLSDYFDVDPKAEPTIGDVLAGRAPVKQAIHGDVLPANLSLAEAELAMAGKMGRELTLRKALKKVEEPYDLVLIDCPPALGLLTVNALVAADHALLSSEAQYFAMQGVEQALDVIELARDGLNPGLQWLGVFFNIADMRTVHSREAFANLRAEVGDKLFDTTIRSSIAYAGSAERAVSILEYRPDLAEDYLVLGYELLGRLGQKAARKALRPHLPAQRTPEPAAP